MLILPEGSTQTRFTARLDAAGYVYRSKQKWTGACFSVPRARLLLAQLNFLPCTLAKQGCLVSAVSWESPWPVIFSSGGANSGHNWPRHRQPTLNMRREPHRQYWGPGLLRQEQPPIPKSLLTANEWKRCPKICPYQWPLCHLHLAIKSWKMRKQPWGLLKVLAWVGFLHPQAGWYFTLGAF